jgi:REase_DpnII-MboI
LIGGVKTSRLVKCVKITRKQRGISAVADELSAEVSRYGQHPSVKTLICFVYDPEERIKNARTSEDQLNQLSTPSLEVVSVIVHPGNPVTAAWY